jgi:hypothetical protein
MSKIKSTTFTINCVDMKGGEISSLGYTLGKTFDDGKQTTQEISSTKSALISKVRDLEKEGASVTFKTSKGSSVYIVDNDTYLTTKANETTKDNLSELDSCSKK